MTRCASDRIWLRRLLSSRKPSRYEESFSSTSRGLRYAVHERSHNKTFVHTLPSPNLRRVRTDEACDSYNGKIEWSVSFVMWDNHQV